MRTLIKNGTIVDGTGKEAFVGALFLEDDRISQVIDYDQMSVAQFNAIKLLADRIEDVRGLVVAPGFIDTHSHSDLKVLIEPELLPKLMQGITTEVLGQDGISMAPLPKEFIEPWRKNLAGLNGTTDDIDWYYETCERYFQMIEESGPALNEAYLLPHGNIRMAAMGLGNDCTGPDHIKRMCDITRRAMESGCIGVSSGLIYMPCAYSKTEELVEICKVVSEYDGVFVVHQRSEADDIITSMEEVLHIGEASGVDIHFSHFKVCGERNWSKMDDILALLDEGRRKGIRISLDQYPYPAGSTMLGVILPPWAHDGGTDKLVERLGDPLERARMTKAIEEGIPGWDNFIDFVGEENIYITSVGTKGNEDVIQLSLAQLGEKRGKTALEATYDLLLEEKNAVGMVNFYGTEAHIATIMQREEMNACTDGLLGGKPHPRAYGAFPRILGKYVRDEGVLTMEQAIHKMTCKAAMAMHIKERGCLLEGYYADITIFDPDEVKDLGTYTDPIQHPAGIRHVWVNGKLEVEQGRFTGIRSGRMIRSNDQKTFGKIID